MIIYIAGPYSSGPDENTRRAILVGHDVMDAGHVPYVPHLSHFMELVRPRPYEDWMSMDLQIIPRCDCLIRLSGESSGSDREVALAIELHLPIVFEREAGWEFDGELSTRIVSALNLVMMKDIRERTNRRRCGCGN